MSFISVSAAASPPSAARLSRPLGWCRPPAAGLLEGVCVWAGSGGCGVDRLSPAWACRAETPASSSRLPGPGPALHMCPLSCPRGPALLRPSGDTGGAPALSGPLSLHQQDEGVPSVAAVGWGGAGSGNLRLAETSMPHMFFCTLYIKECSSHLQRDQLSPFFFSWQGGPLGLFSPTFHQKREQRRPAHFPIQPRKQQRDAVEWPGLRVRVEKGSSGGGGSEEPPQGGFPHPSFACRGQSR